MRVIAGKARRLLLKSTPGFDTRPTSDKIKETLFNILQPDIPGSRFLDLFSGSGGIGIEALSRGSSRCVFVENSKKAVQVIQDNLDHTGLSVYAEVIPAHVVTAIHTLGLRREQFDIVYIDPPYSKGYEQPVLEALAQSGIVTPDTQVIIEADIHNRLEFLTDSPFVVVRNKVYKTNQHYFLKLGSPDSDPHAAEQDPSDGSRELSGS